MTPEARQTMEECNKASIALAAWFESQGMDGKKSLGTMAVLMGALIASPAKGDPLRALSRWQLIANLIEAIIRKHLIDAIAGDGE